MKQLKKKYFKNIQFKNMFFKNVTKFCDPHGLKEWGENTKLWLQKREAKRAVECKHLFRNWLKSQIQKMAGVPPPHAE